MGQGNEELLNGVTKWKNTAESVVDKQFLVAPHIEKEKRKMKKLSLRKMFTPIVFILTIGIFVLTYYATKSSMLTALALLAIIDFASGIINAVKNEELDSRVCFNGICKKFYMFAIVAVAHELERTLSIPVFDIVVSFYLANEGLSIMENAGNTIPFPEVLKQKFTQIRGGSSNED